VKYSHIAAAMAVKSGSGSSGEKRKNQASGLGNAAWRLYPPPLRAYAAATDMTLRVGAVQHPPVPHRRRQHALPRHSRIVKIWRRNWRAENR
jgi:hypothetical protein